MVCPDRTPARSSDCRAVSPVKGRAAACSKDTPSGLCAAVRTGTGMNSASDPCCTTSARA